MKVTEEEVYAFLQGLGNTPEEVRATMVAAGIKAKPGEPCGCAIHEAVSLAFPGFEFYVHGSTEQYIAPKNRIGFGTGVWHMPEAANQFAHGFDERHYPELIDHNWLERNP